MPSTISQFSPLSRLRNNEAGSTPVSSSFLLEPASMDQMFASARPSSVGNAGAEDVSLKDLPRSVERMIFMPKNGLQLEKKMFGELRVSTSAEYAGTPGP